MFMRTFEYRLFVNKEQSRKLMACLAESRTIYNGMLETVKAQYEQDGTIPSKYEHPDIGIDVGLKVFLADSEGNTIENPRFYRTSQKTLRRKQRQLCRREIGSHRRRKAARNVAKAHLKINRQRRDHQFKTAK